MKDIAGRSRVVIEGVTPEIDAGRFLIRRAVGERVVVEADIFADGREALACVLRYRKVRARRWIETPMEPLANDRWRGEFIVSEQGRWDYSIIAWIDPFQTWLDGLEKKAQAGLDVSLELLGGAAVIDRSRKRARGGARKNLTAYFQAVRGDSTPAALALTEKSESDAKAAVFDPTVHYVEPAASSASTARLESGGGTTRALDDRIATGSALADQRNRVAVAAAHELRELMAAYPDRRFATQSSRTLSVMVERARAGFSAWYEMFPRSCAPEAGRHGTLADAEAILPEIAAMGFNIVYLPPIHPIGRAFRKGPNNGLDAGPSDPGCPWAIGSDEGGHKAIHPELGTLDDFGRFASRATELGMEVALDLAFQCSPDHPYVTDHPDWFRHRADGSIQYAENPPKKYQDIYPFDFECEDWQGLWNELKSIVDFWIERGVRVFRVDNPHTKPFRFWEWMIGQVKAEHADIIFLAEAFTAPKVMYRLAKLGFTQSYTYFTWRNAKWDLTQYMNELTQTEVGEYFRPCLWPNTPDILHEYLQSGGRGAFMARLVLAATLSSNYGIYGPAFELCEATPREADSEEYLDSEKYEVRRWDRGSKASLREFITRINAIRREHAALHDNRSLRFHSVDNDQIIAYSKRGADGEDVILTVVNLDPANTQSGWTDLWLEELGLDAHESFEAHDLLTDARYTWKGARNYVELDPGVVPAHVLCLSRPEAQADQKNGTHSGA